MVSLSAVGIVVEFLGAVTMVLPDLPFLKLLLTPSVLTEGRRELFDKSSLLDGSEEYEAVLSTVQEEWDGEIREKPAYFLMEKPGPGVPKSLFAVYDEESDGPYGDLMENGTGQSVPDGFDDLNEYIWENRKWDVVCSKQVFDDWVSTRVDGKENWALYTRGMGFLLFIIGFGVQFL
ncbi:hypothetical protein [Haloferax sp. Q22]|uniref:hypothetical protein n=1 Tax=Haloferax sp. (strain Q22) TaxID=1526048 RepID=UPI0012FA5CBC|nr:hypothetical protein [Haloferax sp. Q22]